MPDIFNPERLADYVRSVPNTNQLATEKKNKLGWGPRAAIYGGNAADAITTIIGLRKPGVKEANPLFGESPHPLTVGLMKSLLAIGTDITLSKLAKKHPKLAKGLGYGLGAGSGAVAINNARIIRD